MGFTVSFLNDGIRSGRCELPCRHNDVDSMRDVYTIVYYEIATRMKEMEKSEEIQIAIRRW